MKRTLATMSFTTVDLEIQEAASGLSVLRPEAAAFAAGRMMALSRVAERVRLGGHHVPEEVVRRRYVSGLKNFFSMYRQRVDAWQLYDNSALAAPRTVAARQPEEDVAIVDLVFWQNLLEQAK